MNGILIYSVAEKAYNYIIEIIEPKLDRDKQISI